MQPWLAIADKGGNVSVWDVKTEQLVYETTVGTPDDMAMQDSLLQRAAEKEPDYFGPLLSQVHHILHCRRLPHSHGRAARIVACQIPVAESQAESTYCRR